jgi:hypothetical protein
MTIVGRWLSLRAWKIAGMTLRGRGETSSIDYLQRTMLDMTILPQR